MRCLYCHNPDTWNPGGGMEMTVDELLDKAERYRAYWGTDGGITVSGGEPLMQMDFLTELFRAARRRGVGTCLDTSGQPFRSSGAAFDKFRELMSYTDIVLLDIKHVRNGCHRELTGCGNSNILDCARYLSEIGKPVWIRHVLVPGITDDDVYLRELKSFIDGLHNVERVEVLPYHALGVHKYEKLGVVYPLKDVAAPSPERVSHAERILSGGCKRG